MRTQPSFARVLLLGFSLFAAGCADFHLPVVSNGPSPLYSVTASSTAFYSHSPRQGTPDQEIPRDTLVRLARYSPSFAKVTLVDGQEGYVATNDIAPSAHTAAA